MKKGGHVEFVDEHPWYAPLALAGLPAPLAARGKDSVEKVVSLARSANADANAGTLLALLHSREE